MTLLNYNKVEKGKIIQIIHSNDFYFIPNDKSKDALLFKEYIGGCRIQKIEREKVKE